MTKYKIVCYINQSFAGTGSEEKAGYTPGLREGVVGSGVGLKAALGEDYEIVSTTICNDNYLGENLDIATDTIIEIVKRCKPDVFMAGPTFNAGHYGVACGIICKTMGERLDIPATTGMYIENPSVDTFHKDLIIVDTPNSAVGMPKVLPVTSALIKKMTAGEEIPELGEGGYIERGIRVSYLVEKGGSERALKMLVKKLKSEEYDTDLLMPKFDRVAPAEPVRDIKHTKITVAISDGIVPTGNPDRIESSNAAKRGKHDITGMGRLSANEFITTHGEYDRQSAMANSNTIILLGILRKLKKAGKFDKLANYSCATTGTGIVTASAARFGSGIGQMFIGEHVDAVILASTWDTRTHCGATMVKGIKRYGTPIIYMTTIVPISLAIGVNRIIPGIGIPYPLGDPPQGRKDSYKLRLSMVRRALKALQTPVDDQAVFEK